MLEEKIVNCEFVFKCPQKWEMMDKTNSDDVRFCWECKKEVYFADTDERLRELSRSGNCVAVYQEVPKQNPEFGLLHPEREILAGVVIEPQNMERLREAGNREREEEQRRIKARRKLILRILIYVIGLLLLGAILGALFAKLR